MLIQVLLLLALVCFVLAALQVPTGGRVNVMGLGLAFWVLSSLLI